MKRKSIVLFILFTTMYHKLVAPAESNQLPVDNVVSDTHTKQMERLENTSLVYIKKCCQPNETLSLMSENLSCEPNPWNTEWKPKLYSVPEEQLTDIRNISFQITGLPNCKWTVIDNKLDIWFNILEDGSVAVGLNFWTIPLWLKPLDTSGYCLDVMTGTNESAIKEEDKSVLVFCELENFSQYLAIRTTFGIMFMASSFSVLITIVIYVLIWNEHSIHGWTQFSFFLSMLLYYMFEGSRIFAKLNGLTIKPTKACFVHAIIAHYFTLVISGSSCTMSIDCFITFWKLRSIRSKTKRDLMIYLFFAWGVPLISLSVGLYLHFINNPLEAEKEVFGVFEYAHYRCSSPVWEFAFRVQLISTIVNVLALLGTVYFIVKHSRSTAMAHVNRQPSNKYWTKYKKSLKLFLKLFFITGISMSVNAIDLLFGFKNPMGWHFILFRVYISLQGVVYLIIFGFHSKNFVRMRKKYPVMNDLLSYALLRPKTDLQRSNDCSGTSRNQPITTLTNNGSVRSQSSLENS